MYYWLFFILQPFLTTVYTFKNYRSPIAPNIIWAFTVFYAMTIAVGIESQGSDIVRYMARVEYLNGVTFSFYSAIVYSYEIGEIDFLNIILSIIVSRFTDDGLVLVVIHGIIFGYFFSRNMWYVLLRVEGDIKWFVLILIILLFLITPIWQIIGFRFQTATHAFIYGLLPFLFEGKKNKLWWCVTTPFIFHFAYLFPLFILGLYLLIGNRMNIYFAFFIFGVFFAEINITEFNKIFEAYAPEILIERTSSYRSEDIIEARTERIDSRSFHAQYYMKGRNWPIIILLALLFWKSRSAIRKHEMYNRAFSFILLFYGAASILSSIPSGGRFLAPASILSLAFMIFYFNNFTNEKVYRNIIPLLSPLMLFYIFIQIRIGLYTLSITTIFGNPVFALLTFGDNVSLNDLLIMLR